MSRATNAASKVLGNFIHSETGEYFEYIKAEHPWAAKHNLPYEVFISPCGETRFAKLSIPQGSSSVAYVAIDEAADGTPVLEYWPIEDHECIT